MENNIFFFSVKGKKSLNMEYSFFVFVFILVMNIIVDMIKAYSEDIELLIFR